MPNDGGMSESVGKKGKEESWQAADLSKARGMDEGCIKMTGGKNFEVCLPTRKELIDKTPLPGSDCSSWTVKRKSAVLAELLDKKATARDLFVLWTAVYCEIVYSSALRTTGSFPLVLAKYSQERHEKLNFNIASSLSGV
jgi:hypothetical protein